MTLNQVLIIAVSALAGVVSTLAGALAVVWRRLEKKNAQLAQMSETIVKLTKENGDRLNALYERVFGFVQDLGQNKKPNRKRKKD